MPALLGAAIMETDRMIPTPQHNGASPPAQHNGDAFANATIDNSSSNGHNSSTSPPGVMANDSSAFVGPSAPLYINSAARKKKSDRPPPPVPPGPPPVGLLGHPDHLGAPPAPGMDASSSLSTTMTHSLSGGNPGRPQPPPPPPHGVPSQGPPGVAAMPAINHYVNEPMAPMGNGGGGIVNMAFAKESVLMGNGGGGGSSELGARLNATRDTTLSVGAAGGGYDDSDGGEQQEVIQVQILPQDDNWGGAPGQYPPPHHPRRHHQEDEDGLGGVGGAHGGSGLLIEKDGGGGRDPPLETGRGMSFRCRRHAASMAAAVLAMLALLSPVLMVALPSLRVLGLSDNQLLCGVDCDGLLLALAVKLLVLAAGCWAVFARPSRAALPRLRIYRAVVFVLVLVFLAAFWLFYAAHLIHERELVQYRGLVGFASGLVDALLFVHYLAVLLLELRHRVNEQFYIKVVRSPDGESRGFPVGPMSVQRAASWVLDRYYTEFSVFNPYLDRLVHPGAPGGARGSRRGVKVYDIDGHGANINDGNSTVVSVASKRGGLTTADHHRMLEEHDHERKVRKRRARLMTAAEEAFTHIRRIREGQGTTASEKSPMESYEAAQSIFPTLSRPLQKYLRATRQQPRHTQESVLAHLSTCLSFDMSPRAFLERYLTAAPVLQSERELRRGVQQWSLVSERSLYRELSPGCVFQLRQGDVALLCSVQPLPHFAVAEEIIEPTSNRFVLRINSETSV